MPRNIPKHFLRSKPLHFLITAIYDFDTASLDTDDQSKLEKLKENKINHAL